MVKKSVSWHDAKAACEMEDGKLVSIHSPAENTFIALKHRNMDLRESWTGLNDRNGEGTFEWIDSTPADFFNWAENGRLELSTARACHSFCKQGTIFSEQAIHNFEMGVI